MITLFIDGIPVPQGRPRAFRMGNTIRMYDPKTSKVWKEYIKLKAQYADREMLEGALKMELVFFMPRPKSLPKKVIHHAKKPDVDNLAKAVKDGLEGVFYKNDSQVCELSVRKVYCLAHQQPGVQVQIEPMELPF